MNGNILKSKIKLNKDKQESLAKYLGITNPTLSLKINGKSDFLGSEIQLIKQRYNLTPDEIDEIFFDKESS